MTISANRIAGFAQEQNLYIGTGKVTFRIPRKLNLWSRTIGLIGSFFLDRYLKRDNMYNTLIPTSGSNRVVG